MIINLWESIVNNLNFFDTVVSLIFLYCIIQCFLQGFFLKLDLFYEMGVFSDYYNYLGPKTSTICWEHIESEFIILLV